MQIKQELAKIVGSENVSDDPQELAAFSRDHSLAHPRMPNYVARPDSAERILKLIQVANEHGMPLVPCSSSVHFNGCTVPEQGGIIVDLRGMKRILGVDERNRKVRIEPGVTWAQLQTELAARGYMPLFPFLPHAAKSALTSHLEREPILIPKFEFAEPLLTTEVVWPKGQIFRTGAAAAGVGEDTGSIARGAFPHGPGLDWWRLFQGAQGTMGILTWANVKMEILPEVNKAFFMPVEALDEAVEPVYRVGWKMIGYELLILNRKTLATVLAAASGDDPARVAGLLAPWTVVLVLSGAPVRPEERIEYEEEALREIANDLALANVRTALPGLPGAERDIVELLRRPWPEEKGYWKWMPRGDCADLMFLTTLERAGDFVDAVAGVAVAHGYPVEDVGCYVQPMEYGRACHLEFNFFYDAGSSQEVDRIEGLYADAAKAALELGAFYSRPYGMLADLVYPRMSGYTMMLRKTKEILDPNNILNPGKLCF